VPASSPIIILDAGPLIAAINERDPDHLWAQTTMLSRYGPFIVTSSAIAEATHGLGNSTIGMQKLRTLVERMQIEDPAPVDVLDEMAKWKTRMDYADACAVLLARRHTGATVLTTDHTDFTVYRVPFISPRGSFKA
jgi:predicted nucleic acid-binding protein